MNRSILRRYTDIPALIYLLSESKITLLDPQYWDDKNDSSYMAIYKRKRKLKSLLALCFTQASETYHHWRVFADGPSGVCINFRKGELTDYINGIKLFGKIEMNQVTYKKIKEIKGTNPKVKDLPFLKRFAFGHEDEFRIIFESKRKFYQTLDISIPLSCIEKIVLSPWIHEKLGNHLKDVLQTINTSNKIKIVRSTLISNQEWQSQGEMAE